MAGGDIKGRAGREQRAFFGRQCHSGPAHFPVGLEEVSGRVPGLGLVELLPGVCGVGVLQLLVPEQSCKYT